MIRFDDVFSSSFLESGYELYLIDMVLAILLAFAMGLFIFFVYKKSYAGVMYSSSFGVTLIALTMITTLLILAVTSNVVLSLGMVGALSIVRFRTAIKDPSDIVFLFWSVAAGIVLAAGFFHLAVFGSIMIGIVLLLFSRSRSFDKPYILMVHCMDAEVEKQVKQFVAGNVKKFSLKSKSVAADMIELNYEIRLKDEQTGFINELAGMSGVSHTVMVSYNGDYMC